MKKLVLAFSALALLMLASCKKDINVEIENIDKLPVVYCEFSSDSIWKVYVGTSGSPVGFGAAYPSVKNAVVEISANGVSEGTFSITEEYYGSWRGGGVNFDTLHVYYIPGKKPIPGVKYDLKVTVPGIGTVTASDYCVEPVQVFNVVRKDSALLLNNDYYTNFKFSINDNASVNDYYAINMYFVDTITNEARQMEFYTNDLSITENLAKSAVDAPGPQGFQVVAPKFSDQLFNGQKKEFSINFADFYNKFPDSKLRIVIRKISAPVYKFESSSEKQQDVNGNPFAEPVRIISNIKDGLGVFGSFSNNVINL